jgi:hypothetical protein
VQHVTADLSLVVGTALNGTVLCLAALDQKKKSMRVVLDGADSHHSGGGALYCSAVVGTHVWGVLLPGQSSIQYVDMRAWLEMWLHTDAHAPPHALLQTDFVLSEQYLGLKPIGTHRLELGPCLAGGEGSSAWGALSNATYESGISSCYLHIFRTALDHTQTVRTLFRVKSVCSSIVCPYPTPHTHTHTYLLTHVYYSARAIPAHACLQHRQPPGAQLEPQRGNHIGFDLRPCRHQRTCAL